MPTDKRDRLTEPYVTTRTKGTGLGLAIVKTILEDHDAVLELRDREDVAAGTSVKVVLPVLAADSRNVQDIDSAATEDVPGDAIDEKLVNEGTVHGG